MRGLWLILGLLGVAILLASANRQRPERRLPVSPIASAPEQPAPEPLRVVVAGKESVIRLDALIRYGATSTEALCAPQPDAREALWRERLCRGEKPGDGELALMEASARLAQGLRQPPEQQAQLICDANGLILLGLTAGPLTSAPGLPNWLYDDLGDKARDGRIYEIAAELWLARSTFCETDKACKIEADENAGRALTNAGRWFNDTERLKRAAALLEGVMARGGDAIDAVDLFYLRNHIGNAYSYASTFAAPVDRLPLIERAVAAYEPALPHADANAPSFRSAMLWQNLGAAYVDRGQLTGDKRDFERGLVLYEKSLPLFDHKSYRQSWARAKSNMGEARSRIAAEGRELALHDAAIRDHDDSIKAFEEGNERLDAGFSRYRLAKALSRKAATADELVGRLADTEAERRSELEALARTCRNEALAELARAGEVMRQAGAKGYLALIENLTSEIRLSLAGPRP